MPAKSATTREDLRRIAVEQEQLREIAEMKAKFHNMAIASVIDQPTLDSLGVVLGQPLDVDDSESFWDSDTRFFQPWVPDELLDEAASNRASWSWMDKLEEARYKQPESQYGELKAQWFNGCLDDLYEMDKELWEPWVVDPYTIREHSGLDLPLCRLRIFDPATDDFVEREYSPEAVYFPVDRTKPHVACFAIDSNHPPGDKVLRSDLHYAIQLVKFRLEKGQHTGHHTKPSLIYTLERDQWARITQVHFDTNAHKLVLRQSRQLDLRGPTPPPDAFLLLRWMTSRPAGDTEYVNEEEPPKEEVARDEPSSAAPKLLLGCA
ncbi:hypothetical protein F5144DRAFT_565689 [Chaetomium tenue]|uniref:Uncharacterized protein n=1 Tax=Chaetomium tenue TaxID=1854479 RepID=A0ACB7PFQ4_9PEZI|nr:hypothetical protein F5144DRAFT_565689 [Chaetomium globosum]